MSLRLTVLGLAQTQKNLEEGAKLLYGSTMVSAVQRASLRVMRNARQLAPVDTGQLKNSIVAAIEYDQNTLKGVVGSNLKHAPWIEFGTGVFVGKSPYFPPPAALAVWARRHGINPYALAISIYRRGGTKGRKYLQTAFDNQRPAILAELQIGVASVVSRTNKGS